jgi:hypothetical protein
LRGHHCCCCKQRWRGANWMVMSHEEQRPSASWLVEIVSAPTHPHPPWAPIARCLNCIKTCSLFCCDDRNHICLNDNQAVCAVCCVCV